jgi:hypothetical protein
VEDLKKTIANNSDRLMLLFIEIEGWDCWLQPGEAVELRASVESSDDYFDIKETQDGMTIYPSQGMGMITVHQGYEELECGHQRPAGWP